MKPILPLLLLMGLSANAQEQVTVYFNFDIAEANTPSGKKLSQWITKNPLARIQKIYGYADKTGDSLYNQDLSERRASYVYDQLKAASLNLENVEEKSFGESRSTAAYNPKDRKVVIHYARPEVQPAVQSDLSKQLSKAKKGDKIRLSNVNFHMNSDDVLKESRPVLHELLRIMKERPLLKIEIQGHVCCQPENEEKLSHWRALVVYKYLINGGIDESRLSYTSYGSTRPIHPLPEKNEEERVANRRVEIEIIAN